MKLPPLKGVIHSRLILHSPPRVLAEELKQQFTFKNPEYVLASRFSAWGPPRTIPESICLVDEVSNTLVVPKGVSVVDLSAKSRFQWNRIKWVDARTTSTVNYPKLLLSPNKEQAIILRDFQNALNARKRPFGNFMYVAPTSAGKTFATALLARLTAQRTLVLCLTDLIKKAWYDDLLKAFGLKKKDIGLIQQGKWSIGKQFTLASVQTLARRQHLWPELFRQIGCCIVDECQSVRTPSVYNFLKECPAKYLIGATATPKENNFMLYSLLGEPRKRLISEQRKTETSLPLNFVQTIPTSFHYAYDPAMLDWNDLAEHISLSEERNEVIIKTCLRQWKAGESLLVVTKRKAHVHLLAELLKDAGIDDVNILTGDTNADANYTRELVAGILDRNIRCVVATIPAITLGANLNPVSRLHLAMPVANKDILEQLIGRIRRRSTGKSDCELVYYQDVNVEYLRRLYIKVATPVFRKLKVPGFDNVFYA